MSRQLKEEVNNIIKTFTARGFSQEEIASFLNRNFDYIEEHGNMVQDHLYFMYNNHDLYGVLVACDNDYRWSVYHDGEFTSFQTINSCADIKKSDYIVEMMIRFADSDKLKTIVPTIHNMSVEGKVKMLKRIGLNSNGYHFQ